MAAAPGLLAPRAPSPVDSVDGKTVANGLAEQKVIKINVSGTLAIGILAGLSEIPSAYVIMSAKYVG